MTMDDKQKLLIIEDDFDHLKQIATLLKTYDCYPKYGETEDKSNDIKKLRTFITKQYSNEVSSTVQKRNEKGIINYINKINPNCFILDYELDVDNDNCNGYDLFETLLSKKFSKIPVLFICGASAEKINDLRDKIESITYKDSIKLIAKSVNKQKIFEPSSRFSEGIKQKVYDLLNNVISPPIENTK